MKHPILSMLLRYLPFQHVPRKFKRIPESLFDKREDSLIKLWVLGGACDHVWLGLSCLILIASCSCSLDKYNKTNKNNWQGCWASAFVGSCLHARCLNEYLDLINIPYHKSCSFQHVLPLVPLHTHKRSHVFPTNFRVALEAGCRAHFCVCVTNVTQLLHLASMAENYPHLSSSHMP